MQIVYISATRLPSELPGQDTKIYRDYTEVSLFRIMVRMKQGQYIVDRYLPDFVRAAARARGIAFSTLSDDWVLRLEKDGQIRWVIGYQFDVNTAAASALAQDKVATHLLLKQANIPSIEHILIRSLPHVQINASSFSALTEPFVLKPLDGTGGREVRLVSTQQAVEMVNTSSEVAWAASPQYQLSSEYRVIVLDGEVQVAYQKTIPTMLHGLKLFNLGLGAVAVDIADEAKVIAVVSLAVDACTAASLRLASVDIAELEHGELRVLEINDGIMMENYARQSGDYKNRAAHTYDAIISKMFA